MKRRECGLLFEKKNISASNLKGIGKVFYGFFICWSGWVGNLGVYPPRIKFVVP